MPRPSRCIRTLALAALAGAAGCADPLQPAAPRPAAAAAKAGADVSANAVSRGLRKAVTAAAVRAHQAAFQEIADAHGGLRAAGGSGGYEGSLAYVEARLAAAGYETDVQEFSFAFEGDRTPPVFARTAPVPTTYVNEVDFGTLSYSGSGDVTGPLVAVDLLIPSPVDNSSTSGCEAADFAGFPAGSIALVQRGTCAFRLKAANAQAAGAVGVVVMNEGTPTRTGLVTGTLSPPQMSLPIVGATFALGNELRNGVLNGPTGVTVRLRTDVVVETRTGRNLIAETPRGDPSQVLIVGVRLDGGLRGPGINLASGAAVALHVAEVFAAQERTPRNKLRLVLTAAGPSDRGLDRYLASLTTEERATLVAAIGLDAVGSPNFARFVYDGDASDVAGPTPPAGSGAIEALFTAYFAAEGLPIEPAAMPPGSETIGFALADIPVGGLYGGTFEVKSAEQAAIYGGTAGAAFDPCHNLACDTYANTSLTALEQMSDAAAHVVLVLSRRNFALEPLATP